MAEASPSFVKQSWVLGIIFIKKYFGYAPDVQLIPQYEVGMHLNEFVVTLIAVGAY